MRIASLALAVLCSGCLGSVPSTPRGLVARAGNGQVQLSWSSNGEIDLQLYNLYWGAAPGDLPDTRGVGQPATRATVSGLTNGHTYYFAIDAENLLGQRSPQSEVISATPTADGTPGSGNGSGEGAPEVVGAVPQNGMVNVSLSQELRIEFSEAIDVSTFQIVLSPSLYLGSPEWSNANQTVRFPAKDLYARSTVYRVTVDGADLDGNRLTGTRTFQFATDSTDNVPPMVVETAPVQGATQVSVDYGIAIRFSEPMSQGAHGFPITVTPDFLWDERWSALGDVLYLIPYAPLQFGTQYTFSVSTAAQDLWGNALAAPYVGTFATVAAPDRTLPYVVSQDPAPDSTAYGNPPPIVLRFSEPMDQAFTQGSFFLFRESGMSTPGLFRWNIWGTELTFHPSAPFASGERLTLVLGTMRDLAGNAASAYTTQFCIP